jgi:hypothetical protein
VKVSPLVSQVENGVAYELTRTMIGNIASSINEKKGESGLSHLLAGDENVIQAARPADGDGRRMFQEQQEIRDFPLDPLMMKPSLQLPSLPIFHYPKIPNVTHLLNTVSMWLLLSRMGYSGFLQIPLAASHDHNIPILHALPPSLPSISNGIFTAISRLFE